VGIVLSVVLNVVALTGFLMHEYQDNGLFHAWSQDHKLSTFFITLCSIINTKHTCLLNSQILNLKAFSAPLSTRSFIWLQVCGCISMLCCEVPCLVAQILILQYLQNVDNDATIGFIFNSFNLLFGVLLWLVTCCLVSAQRSSEEMDKDKPTDIDVELDGLEDREGGEKDLE